MAPYGYYPSKQPIESEGPYKGKTLGEVPAKDWPTLTEVAEKPWSSGPYIIKEWVKGEKIVFEANPYFFKGTPKSKNLVLAILTPENAEAQLLAGQVDLLGSETLAGLSEQLVQGEKDGKVKNYIIAGGTWEHIDINLFLK
jgi:ABC-type transport system substrate-binding protein